MQDGDVSSLTSMDKNFIWRNSETITNTDGVFNLKYPETGNIITTTINPHFTGELTKNSNTLEYKTNNKANDDLNVSYSINKIKVLLESITTIDKYGGEFSGVATLTLVATNIDKSKITKRINIDLGFISPKITTFQPYNKTIEETIVLDSPINFNSNCVITLEGGIIHNDKTTVAAKIDIYGTKTTKPSDEIINSGIGEYLMLKDGKLVLKGNLFGNDRHVHINAGGANYITNWKFNSQIQFKNEFAI